MSIRSENPKLQELFDKKIPVYSFSKLNSWNDCKYNWYKSYVLKERGKDNIYTKIGNVIHDSVENIYKNKGTLEEAKIKFNNTIKECKNKGIDFPNNPPSTKINYIKNINHFFDNYNILDIPMKTEYFVLYKIPRINNPSNDEDYIWIQMYIDSIMPQLNGDGEIESMIINDWKTSSKFDKDKLKNAGRQLILYKLGLEQQLHINVSKVGWTMLKYVNCCYMTKGSKKNPPKVKKSMQQRKDAVKYFKKKAVNYLINNNVDTIEAELLVANAINKNDMNLLPKDFLKTHWIEDCWLEYKINKNILNECIMWIKNTVKDIEIAMKKNDLNNYPPKEINDKSSYFCFNLCGRPNCIYLTKYKQLNSYKFKNKDANKKYNDEKGDSDINRLFNKNKKQNLKLDIDKLFV